jgi:hypothetical protein
MHGRVVLGVRRVVDTRIRFRIINWNFCICFNQLVKIVKNPKSVHHDARKAASGGCTRHSGSPSAA